MITLLLDTSSNRLSIALAREDKVIAAIDEVAYQIQSEIMIERINTLLKSANLSPKDINKLGVAYGPGSYTGVRIAVSIAKVWAYAKKIELYAVSSLSVFKDAQKPTICVLDARSDRSFVGIYSENKAVVNDHILTNSEVLELANSEGYLINGETKHLGIESGPFDRFANMLSMMSETTKITNIARFKPVYLKG